jgi:hypothetical protein
MMYKANAVRMYEAASMIAGFLSFCINSPNGARYAAAQAFPHLAAHDTNDPESQES